MTAAQVIKAVSTRTGVSAELMLGRGRVSDVMYARHLAAYLLRERGWTYRRIGVALRRSRWAVRDGARSVAFWLTLPGYQDIAQDVAALEEALRGE